MFNLSESVNVSKFDVNNYVNNVNSLDNSYEPGYLICFLTIQVFHVVDSSGIAACDVPSSTVHCPSLKLPAEVPPHSPDSQIGIGTSITVDPYYIIKLDLY